MKTIQQEIFLVKNSTLSRRQLCEKDSSENKKQLSETEQLEEACWNGLLDEILSGIISKSSSGKRLSLWQIRHGASFLDIELSEYPSSIREEYSINPYCFLEKMCYN